MDPKFIYSVKNCGSNEALIAMKPAATFSLTEILNRAGFRPGRWLALALVVLIVSWGSSALCRAQPTEGEEQGTQVLTRGPVHEAFAGIVSYDATPGSEVTKAPPELIEEVPPDERPEGDNVAWIPGYWGWDDERSDFLWISGTWRTLPPGREWMAGYWNQTHQGYQWISGYWTDASATETTYLPAPPATVESGPNIEAPSSDYEWSPGCWMWFQGRYAWRPGYWIQGRADWDWTPAHFVWTPRGYIFVEGFWDYPVERRGMLFAPVYFESRVYSRRGYHYSPTIVIDLGVFSDHLFLRPRYSHYYFGDYYASSYQQGGFYASFSFQTSRYGYDPFYSRQRWAHRDDRGWENRVAASYQYRRDHEAARPPRTWSAQIKMNARSAQPGQDRISVGVSIDQMTKRKDNAVRFQTVDRNERQQLAQRGQELQKNREQRRTVETKVENQSDRKPGAALAPVKVPQDRSPIAAKPANQLNRNQTPPKAPKAPKPNPKFQPNGEAPAKAERRAPAAQTRKPEVQQPPQPARVGDNPARAPRVQPEVTAHPNAAVPETQQQSPRKVKEPEPKTSKESERPIKPALEKTDAAAQQNARELEKKNQQESQKREKEATTKAQEQSQRQAQELARKAQQESEQQAKVATIRAQEESLRSAQAENQKARQESVQPEKKRDSKAEKKGAPKPPKNEKRRDEPKKDEQRPTPAPDAPPAS